jgi:hypothetical protein
MAGPIGRLTAALSTIYNENSVSLANLNFDFTLVKLEAPVEYQEVGTTISRRRKLDAEEGNLHRTARKLGALFQGSIPSSAALFKAYGTRVSEIAASKSLNPQESDKERHGIFASQVGADSASIWAAVTSGPGAIAVHLLACMLARLFTDSEATSVWVELVENQKAKILAEESGDGFYTHQHNAAILAAQQQLSRGELANWDASARAWLQSADHVKARQHKQMMLILENAKVPINTEPATYESVMLAWSTALTAMDNLVRGMPQQVRNGAALLGISSWHMFPDMVLLGDQAVEIVQSDPLFGETSVLTLGIQATGQQSVSWSLPLARLQYYGGPIRATRSAGTDNTRITQDQFAFVVIGSILAGWKDAVGWEDFKGSLGECTTWLQKISLLIKPDTSVLGGTDLQQAEEHIDLLYGLRYGPPWFRYLCAAAQRFRDSDDLDKKVATQLTALGTRQSRFWLLPSKPPPMFGLSTLSTLLPLLKNEWIRVDLLRKFCARTLPKDHHEYMIRYRAREGYTYEFATPLPIVEVCERLSVRQVTYRGAPRWSVSKGAIIVGEPADTGECNTKSPLNDTNYEFPPNSRWSSYNGSVVLGEESYIRRTHSRWLLVTKSQLLEVCDDQKQFFETYSNLKTRMTEILDLGENCFVAMQINGNSDENMEVVFSIGEDFVHSARNLYERSLRRSDENSAPNTMKAQLRFIVGSEELAALYSTTKEIRPFELPEYVSLQELDHFLTHERTSKTDPEKVEMFENTILGIHHRVPATKAEINLIEACEAASRIYKLLPNATLSTRILSQELGKAKWITSRRKEGFLLSRAQTLACILMFDSGVCNLDPEIFTDVMAISSGGSLYIAGPLLCDPFEEPGSTEVRRVVGNIGRPGISLLVPPPRPRMKGAALENWRQINHNIYNGTPEDCFSRTSIHLSFTEYEMPLKINNDETHMIDRPVNLVETLVQVFDRGHWVADLNVLGALESGVIRATCKASDSSPRNEHIRNDSFIKSAKRRIAPLIAIDTWDELFDPPKRGTIVARAHGNWLARLGLTVVCRELGFRPIILPKEVCWSCCVSIFDCLESEMRKQIIRQSKASEGRPGQTEKFQMVDGVGVGKIALIQ